MSKKSSSKHLKFLRNCRESTVNEYSHAIKRFEKLHKMDIDELIDEALMEQATNVPTHKLSIIGRIEDFQDNLADDGLVLSTINKTVGIIKTLYYKNRVNIPYIEPLNPKNIKRRSYLGYEDILTHDELRMALGYLRPPQKARAMVMIQGGLSNEECEHLTTRAFIDETRKYHNCDDDMKALKWLEDENHPIIWVTQLIRIKTGKPYYALIGAEAVNSIASAKLYELGLPKYKGKLSEKLLDHNKVGFNTSCDTANKKSALGYVGAITYTDTTDDEGIITIRKPLFVHFEMVTDVDYDIIKNKDQVIIKTLPNTEITYKLNGENKFSPHKLRKFHATHIRGNALTYEESSLTNFQIDELQGRGKTSVQDTYIKTNPLEQKLLYAKVMNNLSLWHEYEYTIVDGDVVLEVVNHQKENVQLKKKVSELSNKLRQKEMASQKVNTLKEELGEDTFNEIVLGILNAS